MRPSGLKTTLLTPLVCPVRVLICLPVAASPQTHGVVITPTCERATIGTKNYTPDRTRMPCEVLRSVPVSASHKRTVLSSLPLASVRPSGLKATLLTQSVCPVSVPDMRACLRSTTHGVVHPSCERATPTESNTQDETRMPCERADMIARLRIPQPHGVVPNSHLR